MQAQYELKKIHSKKIAFGKEVLGPIMFDFFCRLHAHLTYYDTRDCRLLFCSRAGIRIKYLYEVFLRTQGYTAPKNKMEILYISRFMTAKGIYNRNPSLAYEIILSEFKHTSVREMLYCLLPIFELKQLKQSDFQEFKEIIDSPPSELILKKLFDGKNAYSDLLRKHYSEQSTYFEKQISNMLGSAQCAVLIDTGWQATIQRLLMETFSEIDWNGLYFGRMVSNPNCNNWHFFNTVGVVFETSQYDSEVTQSVISHYHHIIEDLFEPPVNSVEYLKYDKEMGKVSPPDEYFLTDCNIPLQNEFHYLGVVEYCISAPRFSLNQIRKNATYAWEILHEKICFPSVEDVDALEVRARSADFGKTEHVPILNRSQILDREQRLAQALWKQGQMVLEYTVPSELKEKLDKFNESKTKTNINFQPVANIFAAIPKVAIITRTKNRPIMLKRAAESVANQIFKDYVWVVVNDGGCPNTVDAIIKDSPVDLSRTIVVHNEDSLGMEAASNKAISHSNSEYIVIHDDDDSWHPDFLSATVAFLEKPPVSTMKGVITYTRRLSEIIIDDSYVEILDDVPYNDWVINVHLYEMASQNFFAPICFLFSRSVYNEIGGFDQSLPVLGDWDFNIRFLTKCDIGVIPNFLAYYHHRDYQKTGDYSNSVYGAISKHAMYEAIVRNRYLRGISDIKTAFPMMGILALGRATSDIRGLVQQLSK